MTVIAAAVGSTHIGIASDSLHAWGDRKATTVDIAGSKLIACGSSWIGYAGESIYAFCLEDYLSGLKRKPTLNDERAIFQLFSHLRKLLIKTYGMAAASEGWTELGVEFLIANPYGLFTVDGDLAVTKHHRYCAIGTGRDFALGALHILDKRTRQKPEESAVQAAEAAIKLDLRCGGAVEYTEIRLKPRT